jgi:hypothetical protein
MEFLIVGMSLLGCIVFAILFVTEKIRTDKQIEKLQEKSDFDCGELNKRIAQTTYEFEQRINYIENRYRETDKELAIIRSGLIVLQNNNSSGKHAEVNPSGNVDVSNVDH